MARPLLSLPWNMASNCFVVGTYSQKTHTLYQEPLPLNHFPLLGKWLQRGGHPCSMLKVSPEQSLGTAPMFFIPLPRMSALAFVSPDLILSSRFPACGSTGTIFYFFIIVISKSLSPCVVLFWHLGCWGCLFFLFFFCWCSVVTHPICLAHWNSC